MGSEKAHCHRTNPPVTLPNRSQGCTIPSNRRTTQCSQERRTRKQQFTKLLRCSYSTGFALLYIIAPWGLWYKKHCAEAWDLMSSGESRTNRSVKSTQRYLSSSRGWQRAKQNGPLSFGRGATATAVDRWLSSFILSLHAVLRATAVHPRLRSNISGYSYKYLLTCC